jgi:lipoyl(octanoyl) transferase
VGYPILKLSEIRRDVVWYVRQLEEAMIVAAAAFGVAAFRIPGRTGIWVQPSPQHMALPAPASPPENGASPLSIAEEKLGAIGVHISRWVTSHGFAFNVNTDLAYFDLIVPCGIADRRATSMEKLLGRPVPADDVIPHMVTGFGNAFGLQMITAGQDELQDWISAVPQQGAVAV